MEQKVWIKQDGAALVIALLIMGTLLLLGTAFMTLSSTESQIARNERDARRAFYTAEAGLARARRDLVYDFINDPSGVANRYLATPDPLAPSTDTTPGTIFPGKNGLKYYDLGGPIPPSSAVPPCPDLSPNAWAGVPDLPYAAASLDSGSYRIKLKNVDAQTMHLRVTSTLQGGAQRVLEACWRVEDLSPWNTAIFGGSGSDRKVIRGNMRIAGSAHLLGTSLDSSDIAVEFSSGSGSGVHNYYKGIDAVLAAKIPSVGNSLNAEFRVKRGLTKINNMASSVGEVENAGTSTKEKLDGVFTKDGFTGSYASQVYADVVKGYDVPSEVVLSFPSFNDSEFTSSNALELTGADIGRADRRLILDEETPAFSKSNAFGSIAWSYNSVTETGRLTISGKVFVSGTLILGSKEMGGGIIYHTPSLAGSTTPGGSIQAKKIESGKGDIEVHADLLPTDTFPTTDRLGLIAEDDIKIATAGGDHAVKLAAALYAKDTVRSRKANQIAGALVAKYFDVDDLPSLFQVPALARNLPPGLPGSTPIYYVRTLLWREVRP